jgi:hypothetical protein
MTRDVLLSALRNARYRKEQADRDIRLLLAYAREIIAPRPYRLTDLAEAAGMSISGIRTAYGQDDIEQATQLVSPDDGLPCLDQRHIEAAVAAMLAVVQHQPVCEHDTTGA